ncbi:hypothetical protein [Allorhizobium taibaishanense]|uniref:Uncharacterized protein n=1 Tax=Allorhizobium taibaishanense TaxID=887144 RepID=A0A1Q9A367_9HYPH|nr:hypothetical protein [Allorhizobium taibaishanense]MBB4005955.1 hypothetical protein [Allorhizobium taibaishanense]OLP48982.1 hypothetical protein BJF91_17850 [Allorhizobium taibaishanense]
MAEEEIIEHHRAGTLPELFIERTRSHRNDDVDKTFQATLTKLHNDGEIDVLESARTISASSINQHDFFTVMHTYCELIPTLQAEVPAMLAAVKALVVRAGDDLTSGMPNGAYRTWAEQGERARMTLATLSEENPEDSAYVFLGLQALAKGSPDDALREAIAYLKSLAAPVRSAAAKAIGTIALDTPQARNRAVDALVAATDNADDNSLGDILTAICEIARAYPEMDASAVALIQIAAPQIGDHAIHQLSLELMFHGEGLPPKIVAGLTTIMHKVAIGNRGTLENIDAAGSKLVARGRLEEGLALITPLIARHDELTSLEEFGSFSYALLQLRPDQLAEVMIGWLLSLDANLGHATLSLVGRYHGDGPLVVEADHAALGLADADKILLAHRAIGYLFIHAITAASLVLGLIQGASEVPRKVMAEVLFDPLLINYSGELADWLRERVKSAGDPAQPVTQELLARLEDYIEGLRKAGRIKELDPSERERLIESHRQHESMLQVHKQAEKRSILMSLVSRSVILYGTRSISYSRGSDGKKQRHETKLHSFSHSFEAPRLDILEPFDLDYKLRIFRAMQGAES